MASGDRLQPIHPDLLAAVAARQTCRLGRLDAPMVPATLYRTEAAGVVCAAPGQTLQVGQEVRLWFEINQQPHYFSASVLRTGVAVPDRSTHGLLLGAFAPIALGPAPKPAANNAQPGDQAKPTGNAQLVLILSGGTPMNLLADPVRLVQLSTQAIAFQVPTHHPVVFPDNALITLQITDSGTPQQGLVRVNPTVRGTHHVLYTASVEEVDNRDAFGAAMSALRQQLGR